jgi:ABC-type multidrug transport system fused ATPase/permease subunit
LWVLRLLTWGGGWEATATVGLAAVSGLLPLASLVALRRLIDALPAASAAGTLASVVPWAAMFAGAMLLQNVCDIGRDNIGTAVLERLKVNLGERLLRTTGSIPLERFEDPAFRDRLKVASDTLGNDITVFLPQLPSLATSWIRVISMIAFVATLSVPACLLIAAGTCAQGAFQSAISKPAFSMRKASAEAERCDSEIRWLMVDRKNAAEVRIYGLTHLLVPIANRFGLQAMHNLMLQNRRDAWLGSIGAVCSAAGLGAACASLVHVLTRSPMSLGQIGSGVYCLISLSQAMGDAFGQAAMLRGMAIGATDLRAFLQEAEAAGRETKPETGRFESLRLTRVSFTYFGADKPALCDVTCTIRRGERIAIVGPNGAGKTTLAKIALGLYGPSSGERSVLCSDSETHTFGCAFQDFVKFQTTVRDNVAFGDVRREADDDALDAAIQDPDFVHKLPAGWYTKLGTEYWEDGSDLSIGQWQRLALGRTFFRNAEVAVLDEPSASLDPRAELELIRLFRETERDKTILMISHRLGCTRFADRVICVVDGTIAEEGTHKELMKLDGQYAAMYRAQRSWYDAPDTPAASR